jgi:hypothetical protein
MWWEYLIVALLVAGAAGWVLFVLGRAWGGQGGCGCGRSACESAAQDRFACPQGVAAAGNPCPHAAGDTRPATKPDHSRPCGMESRSAS